MDSLKAWSTELSYVLGWHMSAIIVKKDTLKP